MARHGGAFHKIDMLALQAKSLDTIISPVCDDKNGLPAVTSIDDDAVRATQLAGLVSQAAKRPYVLTVAVVLIDVAGAVSIADVDVAVRRDG